MKKQSIKVHLSPYSIVQKRTTTINHAFASAIAPTHEYDELILDAAIRLLSQDPNADLECVYCGQPAETWDHLVGLVKDSELRGFGHQIGNLVPCCKNCNSRKGSKDWKLYLKAVVMEPSLFETRSDLIARYLERYARPVNLKKVEEKSPADWKRYIEIKCEILGLIKEADIIASRLRGHLLAK